MTYLIREYLPEESELACDVRGLLAQESRDRFKKRLETALEWTDHYRHLALEKDGRLVGDIQLRHCDRTMPDGVAHIGIDIAELERGKGAGTSALQLAWEWVKVNGFHRLEGSTDISNLAMRRAFEKAGWNYEGTLKNLFIEDGVSHDYLSFAITT